jgi:hypothetical protein
MAAKKWLIELKARLTDRRPSKESNFEIGEGRGGETRDQVLRRLGLPPDKDTGDRPV